MNQEQQKAFGEEIRNQGLNQGVSMKALVFDPISGDFVLMDKNEVTAGDVVTDMTEKGFA